MAICPECFSKKPLLANRCHSCNMEIGFWYGLWMMYVHFSTLIAGMAFIAGWFYVGFGVSFIAVWGTWLVLGFIVMCFCAMMYTIWDKLFR